VKKLAYFLLSAFAAPLMLPAAAAARPISMADLRGIVTLSSPTISPDGAHAAVVVSRIVWDTDTRASDLELFDLTTHEHRSLTYDRKDLSDPSFSPDGRRLAFISNVGKDDDAKSQVWVMPLDGGDARPITDAPDGVEQFAWRPDGEAIAYAAEDAQPKRQGADKFRDSFVFTTEPITSREEPRPVHLFVIAAQGGKADRLTSGPQSVAAGEAASTLSWSADGKTLAFTLAPDAILNDADREHVELVDVTTRKTSRLTAHTGNESDALFSPDAKRIAYAYSTGDSQVTLAQAYVTSPAGGEGVALSGPYDRAVHDTAWLPDSSGLYFQCANGTTTDLVRAPLAGPLEKIDLGGLEIRSELSGAVARNGAFVFVASRSDLPAELYERNQTGMVTKLTSYNDAIAKLDLASAATVDFPTGAGQPADAVLLKPAGFAPGRRYPLVLVIHGGPTSASSLAFDTFGQLLAARGWLVLEPNYRGSDNLGYAYQHAVLYDPEEGPGKDVMAAVDAVRAMGIVDDRRIAVSGWSYGGIMTAWMISKYHIWRAAVSGASVDDWATDYGTADDSDSDAALFHGSPFTGDAAEYRRVSAITYVKDVTTPVLILSDVGDNRDPFASSSMYWRALRDNHKDATLRVWPINGHFPHDPVRAADVYEHWIDYIAEHF
jgi:dipeptidyl aminopeptidase/acylaminoacyl peptidase